MNGSLRDAFKWYLPAALCAVAGVLQVACIRPPPGRAGMNGEAQRSERLTAASREVKGPLVGGLEREAVRSALGTAPMAVVAVLSAADCFTCEDLGRQLRELRHRSDRGWPLIVVAPSVDSVVVAGWVRRERLSVAKVLLTTDPLRVEDTGTVPSPAVLVIDRRLIVRRGIAHVQRVRNARPRSFAAELGFTEVPVLLGLERLSE